MTYNLTQDISRIDPPLRHPITRIVLQNFDSFFGATFHIPTLTWEAHASRVLNPPFLEEGKNYHVTTEIFVVAAWLPTGMFMSSSALYHVTEPLPVAAYPTVLTRFPGFQSDYVTVTHLIPSPMQPNARVSSYVFTVYNSVWISTLCTAPNPPCCSMSRSNFMLWLRIYFSLWSLRTYFSLSW